MTTKILWNPVARSFRGLEFPNDYLESTVERSPREKEPGGLHIAKIPV